MCQPTELEVTSDRSAMTAGVEVGRRLRVPVNHFEGNFTAPPAVLDALEAEGRVVLRYVTNPNGSARDIAGVCNENGNVVGLMPHPERATSELLGSTDGLVLLAALLASAGLRADLAGAPPRPAGRPDGHHLHRALGLTDDEAASHRPAPGPRAQPSRAGHVRGHVERALLLQVLPASTCGRLPTEGPAVLVGPGENAGVIDAGDGMAVAIRIESHNHPSAIEPYQGAATGVGRDHP